MKKLSLIFCYIIASCVSSATIYRVNYPGNPLVGVDYSGANFSSLVTAANNGDTIQVYANNTTDSIIAIINKPLKIIGFGYNLNINSGYQNVSYVDTVSNSINIIFNPGSAGSAIEGIALTNCEILDSNITVRRCKIDGKNSFGQIEIGSQTQSLSNITINGCYIKKNYDTTLVSTTLDEADWGIYVWQEALAAQSPNNRVNNLKITNNIVEGSISLFTNAGSTGVIANNVIIQKAGKDWSSHRLLDMQFDEGSYLVKNNILFYDSSKHFNTLGVHNWPSKISVNSNAIFANNISNMPTSINQGISSNIFGLNSTSIFAAGFNKGWFTSEISLRLASGSAAINTGKNNAGTATDCGIFGGEPGEIYKISGVPSVPSIFLYTAPAASNTNPTNITISTRTNN
jgi:hypothetical protein